MARAEPRGSGSQGVCVLYLNPLFVLPSAGLYHGHRRVPPVQAVRAVDGAVNIGHSDRTSRGGHSMRTFEMTIANAIGDECMVTMKVKEHRSPGQYIGLAIGTALRCGLPEYRPFKVAMDEVSPHAPL